MPVSAPEGVCPEEIRADMIRNARTMENVAGFIN
jgi:hypothetical protein